jgi:hypothetical protein
LIERCRAILRAFPGLPLTDVHASAPDAIVLQFGPGEERWLTFEDMDVQVAAAGGTPPERFRRRLSGRFRDGHREAAVERIATLTGRTLSSIEHGPANRLTLRFAGGGGIRLLPRRRELDWCLDHERWDVRLDAESTYDRAPRPEREYALWGADGRLGVERSAAGRVRPDAGVAAWDGRGRVPRVTDVLGSLASLPLTGTFCGELLFGDVLRTGDDGEPYAEVGLEAHTAGIAVVPPGSGAAVELREPGAGYVYADLHAAVAPMLGLRPVLVELGEDGALDVVFEGGARIALLPSEDRTVVWEAADGGTRRTVEARHDGSLTARGWHLDKPMPDVGLWGVLGVLRPVPYRPDPPPAPPRPALPGAWAHVLGGLAGRRLDRLEEIERDGLKLMLDPPAVVLAASCHVTIDDGTGRVRHHRDERGWLGHRPTAVAGLRALLGRTVETVALHDGTTLTLALSGGATVVLDPNEWALEDWWLRDHRTGVTMTSPPVFAPTGADVGQLLLRDAFGREQQVAGGLGRVCAAPTSGTGPLHAARTLLAAPIGLPLTRARAGWLDFGEADTRDRHPSPPVTVFLGWGVLRLAAPGERGTGRTIEDDAVGHALAPLLGEAVSAVEHRAPGRLELAFADGHRIAIEPTVTVVPAWSAVLREGGPWIAATDDGGLRAMAVGQHAGATERPALHGSLGTLPAYGFKS